MISHTPLKEVRLAYKPKIPKIFQELPFLSIHKIPGNENTENFLVKDVFPQTFQHPLIEFVRTQSGISHSPLKIGALFSGGQAPGGHNVISGLYDAMKILHKDSELIGFKGGPSGLLENKFIPLRKEEIDPYRNQGGFDLLGSGRTKIETETQFRQVENTVKEHNLHGLVIIGGDDSNTTAALLGEFLLSRQCRTSVVGIPKTIDGDLKNKWIETSFGFDSACKTYSEFTGNILRDALSAGKYYFFIKLMGRSASHIALECALQTQPNLTLISEEIQSQKKSLKQIVGEITDLICDRARQKKNYGVILIPEGLLEFIGECKKLFKELNVLLAEQRHREKLDLLKLPIEKTNYIFSILTEQNANIFNSFPLEIQSQLILDRDSHGNVQVSKIETERLLLMLVEKELQKRTEEGSYIGKFNGQPLFCGYEGRSGYPSNFDCNYCYALGFTAVLLIENHLTGYIAAIQNLSRPPEEWKIGAVPLVRMINIETRNGKEKLVIKKSVVDLTGRVFSYFANARNDWRLNDSYQYPGPMQFFGEKELCDSVTKTLQIEHP